MTKKELITLLEDEKRSSEMYANLYKEYGNVNSFYVEGIAKGIEIAIEIVREEKR